MKEYKKLRMAVYSNGCNVAFLLYRFLRKYANVKYLLTKDYKRENGSSFDIIFINVDDENLEFNFKDLNANLVVAFDSWDSMYTTFENKLTKKLESYAKYYLKYSFYSGFVDQRFKYRLLPLPQNKSFSLFFRKNKNLTDRKINVDFIGNLSIIYDHLNAEHYAQRLDWLKELSLVDELKFRGGLTSPEFTKKIARDTSDYSIIEEAKNYYIDRLPKKQFLKRLYDTKISLCPGGLARWTFRHIESILAKSLVISTDFTGLEYFPKFPIDCFVTIKDGEKLSGKILEILENINDYQDTVDTAFDYWQSYYNIGRYGQLRLFKEFIEQFEI